MSENQSQAVINPEIRRLEAEILQLAAERDEWRADAERLAKFQYENSFFQHEYLHPGNYTWGSAPPIFIYVCRHCHKQSAAIETIIHASDCPITLHRQLVEKYEETE